MTAKKKKLPTSELLRLACLYAEQDRQAWLDSIDADDPMWGDMREENQQFLAQLRAYRIKRWGKTVGEVEQEKKLAASGKLTST